MKVITKVIGNKIDVSKYLDIFKGNTNEIVLEELSNNNVLFFDIETTGLNVKKSFTYLIGIVYYNNDKLTWERTQYFAESLDEESLILGTFNDICKNYTYIVHFNGDHFDIPYVEEKFTKYNITSNLGQLKSLDIYTLVRDYKVHLGLPNCKQKTIETFLKLNRLDIYNGGELISQYFEYVSTNDTNLFNNLILHNAEDLEGMLELLNIINYIKLINILKNNEFNIDIDSKSCTNEKIAFILTFNTSIPNLDIIMTARSLYLSGYVIKFVDNSTLSLSGTMDFGKMYHFFKDHTNYYYVKDMDMAVHKSVSKHIDREKRENAKCSNCYISKTGVFIPVFSNIDDVECFRNSYKDMQNYILFISENGDIVVNEKNLCDYVYDSIKNIGKKM